MKFKFIKRKNSDTKIQSRQAAEDNLEVQDSITAEDNLEVQDGSVADDNPEVQDSITADNNPEVQDSITADNNPEVQDNIVADDNPEVQDSSVADDNPEVQNNIAAEDNPEIQDSSVADDNPEVQDSVAVKDNPEIQDSKVSEDIPTARTSLFMRIFRKFRGGKAAEDNPEVQDSIAADNNPEIMDSIAAENNPEIQDNSVADDNPEVQDSIAAENNPEIQESIAADDNPEVQNSIAADDNPEVQDSIAADDNPEVQDSNNEQQDNVTGQTKNIFLAKKKPWTLAKKIIVSVSSFLVLVALIAGLFFASLSVNPLYGFNPVSEQTDTPMPSVLPQPSGVEETVGPSPTIDPYEVLKAQADFSMLDGIVNILLIGVDHGEERDADKWKGKTAWHSDVMIVLSINTKTNKVSLISLPRDTYAKIPKVTGIYKLNASLNCGGGWPKPEAFQKVCDAASWMIGGIPIQYYYAVDFSAVKGLVDAIGGVDFDLDIEFEINGRKYKKGMQHMNGQGALDYMRVRKKENIEDPNGETGDLNRINRQKAMLVAIFDELKSSGTIFSLPEILDAFDGNLYTNVPLDQTAGLAAYAYKNIDPKTIDVYSMDGKYAYWLFDWHFVITNLSNRVKIIKNVFGIDISKDKQYKDVYAQYKKYTHDRAWSLWFNMQTEVALKKSRSLLDKAKKILDDDAVVTPKPTDNPSTPPTEPPAASPSAPPSATPSGAATGLSSAASFEGSKYGDAERQLYATAESEYTALKSYSSSDSSDKRKDLIEKFKKDVEALCKALSISITKKWDDYWKVIYNAKSKKSINQHYVKNEVYVDFR